MNPTDQPELPPGKTVVGTTPEEKAGDSIGRYKLLQMIGEGGCGMVYMAEQEEPVRRRVALKVIKLGMDTKQVIARFEAERQALAMMDHPNIAKVLDAGSTEKGRPFFVMELVRGIKITDYCDQHKLATPERLRLFIQVCNAIQHAHQKGIIHRDIKPSNILVTLHDGVPVPKVIDFGIAKATQGRLTDQTLFTAFEQFIGTPAYMSPEQAEMSGLDVDTRSDIYALGVLLYELLTGRTPFDTKELLQFGLDELRRTIREKEPERPSTRLNTMIAADLTTIAQRRQSEAPKLVHLMRGDLDWIVMKALEKDRTRRYETANALATDIQRHLDNEPVVARPPSRLYRAQKLIRRNKATFAAIGAGVAALIVGLAVSVYLYIQEGIAYRRALAAEKEQTSLRKAAEQGAWIGQKLTQAGLLIARDQYDEAERIVNEIPRHPASASIFNVLGVIHARRGEWQPAIRNFMRVIDLLPNEHDAYHSVAPLVAQSGDLQAYRTLCLQIIRQFGNSSNPLIAERMAKDCLVIPGMSNERDKVAKMVSTAVKAGPTHKFWDYIQLVNGLANYRQGNFANAAQILKEVVAHDSDPYRTVAADAVLAMSQYQLKQLEDARSTLAKGSKLAAAKVSKRDVVQWNDQISAELLLREAQALIEKDAKNKEDK